MQRVRPVRMSATETAAVWVRWRRGGSISEIGRAMDRSPGSIFYQLATHGGISPVPRTRSWRALTLHDREEISRGLASGRSLRAISAGLGRAPSTISREVQRHGGRAQYRAAAADVCTWYRARRPKPCRLATSAALRALVAAKLAADWSPQQIAGWLKQTFPDHPHLQVSHETIYVSLFVQSRGVLKKELFTHLRRRRRRRQARQATTAGQARGRIIDAVSIRERPAEAADRAGPGHWEGDLLSGARNSHIATLVERRSRFVLLVRLPGKDTVRGVRALSRAVRALPAGLMASLTWDRGGELAAHRTFTVATDVHVYFCDPQRPGLPLDSHPPPIEANPPITPCLIDYFHLMPSATRRPSRFGRSARHRFPACHAGPQVALGARSVANPLRSRTAVVTVPALSEAARSRRGCRFPAASGYGRSAST